MVNLFRQTIFTSALWAGFNMPRLLAVIHFGYDPGSMITIQTSQSALLGK